MQTCEMDVLWWYLCIVMLYSYVGYCNTLVCVNVCDSLCLHTKYFKFILLSYLL
jgi:hypothetical protein